MVTKKKSKKTPGPDSSAGPGSGPDRSDSGGFPFRAVFEWVKSIGVAIALAMLIRWPIAEPFKIPSGSMEPTFVSGDRIFVNKHAYGVRFPFNGFRVPFTRKTIWYADSWLWKGAPPQRWDIVVFKSNERAVEHDTLVKRIVGLSGETILIRDGMLFVNGEAVELDDAMPEVKYTQARNSNRFGLLTDEFHSVVPEGHVFLMGDNSAHSRDGRWFGWMPEHHLLGRVTTIWYPISRWRDLSGFTRSWWWIGGFAVLGLYTLTRLFLGRSIGVSGEGLIGLLQRGEHVFIRFALGLPVPFTRHRIGRGRGLRRGEIILYRTSRTTADVPDLLLGIVAGLPGEHVSMEDGKLHIDGNKIAEPLLFDEADFSVDGRTGKWGISKKKEYSEVPEDHYYVLTAGNGSLADSRVLGWVPRAMVVGSADWVWWPLTRGRRVAKH